MRSFLFLMMVITIKITAQVNDKELILEPIHNLFLSLEKSDSALAHSVFFKDALLATVIEKDGVVALRKEDVEPFLKAIGSPKQISWHEPIWDVKIDQDGKFAQVWASYAFYLGDKFSHCGVDTFQLLKTEAGWKIFYLADTRKKVGCNIPEEITKRYSK